MCVCALTPLVGSQEGHPGLWKYTIPFVLNRTSGWKMADKVAEWWWNVACGKQACMCVLNCEQAEKQQRIIYSGRLLQDDVQLKDVLRQVCVRCPSSFCLQHVLVLSKGKASPYSITERRVPELISVLGSQPVGDVSHKPTGWLPLLSARPAVTLITLKRAATNFAA